MSTVFDNNQLLITRDRLKFALFLGLACVENCGELSPVRWLQDLNSYEIENTEKHIMKLISSWTFLSDEMDFYDEDLEPKTCMEQMKEMELKFRLSVKTLVRTDFWFWVRFTDL